MTSEDSKSDGPQGLEVRLRLVDTLKLNVFVRFHPHDLLISEIWRSLYADYTYNAMFVPLTRQVISIKIFQV